MEEQDQNAAVTGRRQDEIHAAWRTQRSSAYVAVAVADVPAARPPAPQPGVVGWLGYGGLLPFLCLAAGTLQGGPHADMWRAALFAYAAIILSFVGALHWGIALTAPGLDARQRARLFTWSVVPALLAWPSLLLYAQPASILLMVGFAAHYAQDWRLVHSPRTGELLPPWYLPLRLRLTLVACACIATGGLWRG